MGQQKACRRAARQALWHTGQVRSKIGDLGCWLRHS
jgi:hypothetical protein